MTSGRATRANEAPGQQSCAQPERSFFDGVGLPRCAAARRHLRAGWTDLVRDPPNPAAFAHKHKSPRKLDGELTQAYSTATSLEQRYQRQSGEPARPSPPCTQFFSFGPIKIRIARAIALEPSTGNLLSLCRPRQCVEHQPRGLDVVTPANLCKIGHTCTGISCLGQEIMFTASSSICPKPPAS